MKVQPDWLIQPRRRCVETSGDIIRVLSSKASITSLYGNGGAKFRKDFLKIRNADFLISLLAFDAQSVDENTHFAGGAAEPVCFG
jgi:hypothetical protein